MTHDSGATKISSELINARASIRATILRSLEVSLGIGASDIDPEERFHRYGLDSIRAHKLISDLAEKLGRPLSPTVLWDYPTLSSLVDHIAGGPGQGPRQSSAKRAVSEEEPIAIIGLACRFPGAPDKAALWNLLVQGGDAIREVPKERWPIDRYFDPDPAAPAKMSTRWGGFLDQIDRFDAGFFKISPREAAEMDPQQRLALELAWEALEDAGIPPDSLSSSRTGVFFGQMWSDYLRLANRHIEDFTPHTATGQDTSIIAGRISYALGLSGPSLVVNTACSSALVAIHLACQSLLRGESTLALVGGVNMLLTPETTVLMTKFGAMAKDGRSKAFGAGESGYVRGEGGGVVVLKRLSDAIRNGDRIDCVIAASAMNNDGPSNGLTAPSPTAQMAVLREAYERAGIAPERVGYVEAHGTGTLLGDMIEARSLGEVLGKGRAPEKPLFVGSIKSNIGHLEAASGIAGLIKATLVLSHRAIPKSLHSQPPNPQIPFGALGIRVPNELVPWQDEERRAPVAGVNSFGFGGTNCHVVLKGAPPPVRLAAVPAERQEQPKQGSKATSKTAGLHGGLVFVFSGHGGQWQGMGRELILEYPVFRSAVERCDATLQRFCDISVLRELLADKAHSRLHVFEVAQMALFTVQVALGALWRSLGVVPDRVVGHSVGEIAAAHFAGVLDLESAARVIFHRSRLGARNTGTGGMLVVDLPYEEAAKLGPLYGDRFCVGVLNSPTSSVLSGELEAIEEAARRLEAAGIRVNRVSTSQVAGHCPLMEPLRVELVTSLAGLRPRPGELAIVSTVTAGRLPGEKWDAEYWGKNLREMVRFAPAIASLAGEGCSTFLEIGPHPILSQAVRANLEHGGREGTVIASLTRGEDNAVSIARAVEALFAAGRPLPRLSDGGRDIDGTHAELLLISAHTEEALKQHAHRTAELLCSEDVSALRDIAYTAAARRTHHPFRLAVVASSRERAAEELRNAAIAGPRAPRKGRPSIGLYFADGCVTDMKQLRSCMEYDLFRHELESAEYTLERDSASPSPFSVQIAIAALIEALVGPVTAVSGHGHGLAAAAKVAGLLDLGEAAQMVRSGRTPKEASLNETTNPDVWVLIGSGAQVPASSDPTQAPLDSGRCVLSLGDGDGDLRTALFSVLGGLYEQGAHLDGRALYPYGHVAALPSYPFQRERYWLSSTSLPESADALSGVSGVSSFLPRLTALLPGERRAMLTELVTEQVRTVLGFDASKKLDSGAPIREMGLDSMLAVLLRTRLGQGVERALPATLLFDYPTIDALARYLEAEVHGEEPSDGSSHDAYDHLSREALEELLEQKLASTLARIGGAL